MTEKTRIETALLLPALSDARDACVQRLSHLLKANDGIETAHVPAMQEHEPGQICIHSDPGRLSISEVRELARRAGAELESRFGHFLLTTEPMHARQSRMAESRANQITGVTEAGASSAGVVRIDNDRQATDAATVRATVQKTGVRILDAPEAQRHAELTVANRRPSDEGHEHASAGSSGERTELVCAALCGGLLLTDWLMSVLTRVTPRAPYRNGLVFQHDSRDCRRGGSPCLYDRSDGNVAVIEREETS